MTNSTNSSLHKSPQVRTRSNGRSSDAAPMVINRLSGWIDVGELKPDSQAWIIPTRVNAPAR
jgi:hypothetical protein